MPTTSNISVAIRRLLGLGKNAKAAFGVESGTVTPEPVRSSLQAVYGAIEPQSRPEDFERIAEIAHEDQALRAMRNEG